MFQPRPSYIKESLGTGLGEPSEIEKPKKFDLHLIKKILNNYTLGDPVVEY